MLENDNLTAVRRYFEAISSKAPVESINSFYSPDVVQEEMPNRLKPKGDRRGLAELQRDYERGRQIIASSRYDIQSAVSQGDTVVVEVMWTGRLAAAVGQLQPEADMRARCAIVFEFQDGKVVRQRNYDCFDAF
jgi:ketosteroid isomerase-like protein